MVVKIAKSKIDIRKIDHRINQIHNGQNQNKL